MQILINNCNRYVVNTVFVDSNFYGDFIDIHIFNIPLLLLKEPAFGGSTVFGGNQAAFGSPPSFGASAGGFGSSFGGFNKSPSSGFGAPAAFGGAATFGGTAFGNTSPGKAFSGGNSGEFKTLDIVLF